MAAVVALTVRLSPLPGSAGWALQVPSQGASPVIDGAAERGTPPVASPGSRPARVITSAPGRPAPGRPGPGGTIVTAASAAAGPVGLVDDRDVVLAGAADASSAVRLMPSAFAIATGLTRPAEPRVNALMP